MFISVHISWKVTKISAHIVNLGEVATYNPWSPSEEVAISSTGPSTIFLELEEKSSEIINSIFLN
jgi:hypothetical protein